MAYFEIEGRSYGCDQILKEPKPRITTQTVVEEAMRSKLSQTGQHDDEPFCVMDLGYVHRQYQTWKSLLPNVRPYYAVKCNPDPQIIYTLASIGAGFDCASKGELELVLSQNISTDNIIFANPCKKPSDIRYARQIGVGRMTFDNKTELLKIRNLFPDAQLILRVFAADPTAHYKLGRKYGASVVNGLGLLNLAKELGLSVAGVSFHVGSSARDPSAFTDAIRNCRLLIDAGLEIGHEMRILDIGGGFSESMFPGMAAVIAQSLEEYFQDSNIEVIAEPGRYFAEGALTVAMGVIARRDASEGVSNASDDTINMLYLNDGIYGTFLAHLFEPAPAPTVLRASGVMFPETRDEECEAYTLWGPTCDEIDCISKSVDLPANLQVDDWLYFEGVGAYTTCLITEFNGFSRKREIIYVSSDIEEEEVEARGTTLELGIEERRMKAVL